MTGDGVPRWRPPQQDPLVGLGDEGRTEEAIRTRALERDLRRYAAESATFVGTMRDLAEREVAVTVGCATGRSYRGSLVAVAVDHLVVRPAAGRTVHIAIDQVVSVQPEPSLGVVVASGERAAAQDRTLPEVLAEAVADRPHVVLVTRGDGEAHQGRLLGVGVDVVTVLADHATAARYLPAAALSELVVQ